MITAWICVFIIIADETRRLTPYPRKGRIWESFMGGTILRNSKGMRTPEKLGRICVFIIIRPSSTH